MLVDMEEVMHRALAKAACQLAGDDKKMAKHLVDRWMGQATEDLAVEILKGTATLAPGFAGGSGSIQ